MKLDLITLPQFNITNIARCLSVTERLRIMSMIHPRLRAFVYHPQCFPDMSFFPVDDHDQFDPKILSSNGSCGITYVEINIFSKHRFVEVALMAGMWNFRADLWDTLRWPHQVNIESLQLTLDHGTDSAEIHLNCPPGSQFPELPPPVHLTSPRRPRRPDTESADDRAHSDDEIMHSIEEVAPVAGLELLGHHHNAHIRPQSAGCVRECVRTPPPCDDAGEETSFEHSNCISPTTGKPMELLCRLRNLFFIRFDSPRMHPIVHFPRSLWGLGLQSFNSITFSKSWWRTQLQDEV